MSGNFAIKGGGGRTLNGKCHLKFPFWFSAHLPYFLGCHFDTVGWGKDSWWERLILCILLDLLSSVVALFLYLNFFSLSFKKLIVCFGGLAFLHCSSGTRQEVPSGDWALGNSGQQWASRKISTQWRGANNWFNSPGHKQWRENTNV